MSTGELLNYVLGLDLGANSIGWALLAAAQEGDRLRPTGLVATGVRIFEAGVEGDLERGREESRAQKRRLARQSRRRLERTARRLEKVFRLLQSAGLLPQSQPPAALPGIEVPKEKMTARERREERLRHAAEREAILARLDAACLVRWSDKLTAEKASEADIALLAHRLPYVLRARALDEKLPLHELGRALYHLAQRRGFLSNRKAAPKKEENKGVVERDIAKITVAMQETEARTLGEYFSRLDPQQERIRGRWTSRKMYEDEFERLWAAQAPHHPDRLTSDLKKKVKRAIFYQRPLKVQKDLVGECEFESGRKRAPMAVLCAQRFRVLQQVNNTRVLAPDGVERGLTPEEAGTLLDALETQGDVKFAKAKKLLKLSPQHVFKFESGGEDKFIGNRTAAKLIGVFGLDRWKGFTLAQRERVVDDLLTIQKPETLGRRGQSFWGLDAEAADNFARVRLEDTHCRLSRLAIENLLPLMERGMSYMTAAREIYGERPAPPPVDLLPAVGEAMPALRNPAVQRALTELRKVVNAVVRKYGKPAAIRVELARDLRKNRKQREQTWKQNRENEGLRLDAARRLLEEMHMQGPKRSDIEKMLLYQECACQCPYTGRHISMRDLFGDAPQFDVEHIIPFSRSLDDSFLNKTLCEVAENRNVKGNKTPWEAYGHNPQRWSEIIQRVSRFQGNAAREKLRRFQLQSVQELEDFTSSQLNDTRYASVEAVKFLKLLYGEEAQRRTIVQAARGGTTRFLREEFGLNQILGDGGEKSRDDHRHHAVDAVCIALTDPATVKMLSDAAARARSERRRRFAPVPFPWGGFVDHVRAAIAGINVSFRVSRKVGGALHEETFYSPPKKDPATGRECVHVRKPVSALSEQRIENIVDPAVRAAVQAKLKQVGGDPRKLADNPPKLKAKDGREIPIRKVRVREYITTFGIGQGGNRQVVTDTNHHVEIVETRVKAGQAKWEGHVVSQYEALRRLRAKEPVIRREHGEGRMFMFSLALGETVQMRGDDGQVGLFKVTGVSVTSGAHVDLEFRAIADARPASRLRKEQKENPKLKGWRVRRTPDSVRQSSAQKVLVTPLGELRRVGRD
jgi:CRISPR-associated endonuclease Csn1